MCGPLHRIGVSESGEACTIFSARRPTLGVMCVLHSRASLASTVSGIIGNEVEIALRVEALKLGQEGHPVNMKRAP